MSATLLVIQQFLTEDYSSETLTGLLGSITILILAAPLLVFWLLAVVIIMKTLSLEREASKQKAFMQTLFLYRLKGPLVNRSILQNLKIVLMKLELLLIPMVVLLVIALLILITMFGLDIIVRIQTLVMLEFMPPTHFLDLALMVLTLVKVLLMVV